MIAYLRKLLSPVLPEEILPKLRDAQLGAMARQVPMLYCMVAISAVALGITHYTIAPFALTVGVPAVFFSVAVWRSIKVVRQSKRVHKREETRRYLLSTTIAAAALALAMTAWSLTLFNYGTAATQGHVMFFLGITVVGCMACLMHLWRAALMVAVSAVLPTTVFLFSTGELEFIAVAMNFLLAVTAMMFVTLIYARDFAKMVGQKNELVERQVDTQHLSDANLRLANSDSLTGLPNRRRFFMELEERLVRAQETEGKFAVGILDLDGFKPVNDVYGHAVGDKLLVAVAARLRAAARDTTFIARLGGDEFGLIFWDCASDEDLRRRAEGFCKELRPQFDIDGVVAGVAGSMGVVQYPEAAREPEQLFERADYALYNAKETCPGSVALFSRQHEAQIREVSSIEMRLRDADLEDELTIEFQPIVEIPDGNAAGFEVLARWNSPVLGAVSPESFIRSAEKIGVINDLTTVLFKKMLGVVKDWPEQIYASFNLSSHDIASPSCIDELIAILEASDIPAHRITFEVTETAVMLDYARAADSLNKLKKLGARVALDDFGTGFSSLSYVRELPLDRLKIDRSFIIGIETDDKARAVVRSVVELCKSLKLECIVEGVETEAQLSVLQAMGCQKIQGYFFSRPMGQESVGRYLAAAQRRKHAG